MPCYSRRRLAIVMLGLLLGRLVASCADAPPAPRATFHANIAAATDAAASDQSLVLLDFGASWCVPCRVMKKAVFAAQEFPLRAGALRIAEIDIDSNEKAARDFSVDAVPTLVLMTADGKIIQRQVGALDLEPFLSWLATGRQRAREGQWEGMAPSGRVAAIATNAAAGRIAPDELRRLIEVLGDPDPAERASASRIIAAQRERAVPPLIGALSDPYLGVRVGASDLLRRLAPDAPAVDPWQAPADLSNVIAQVASWWKATATLPPVRVRQADASQKLSIDAALAKLRRDDPVERTDAMSALVSQGDAALPFLRDALKGAEKKGDHRTMSLLDDVRWAILVPDTVEARAHARVALARGTSAERQGAATRLGSLGKPALPALGELAGDSDPLVVESAVRALSNIGGADAVPAMAALLQAGDANLRMTAAQALGHAKNAAATRHLAGAVADPNEIVACAAIAAIEEVHSVEEGSRGKAAIGPEALAALKKALGDSRWRVRATAVEAMAKLRLTDAVPDIQALLQDRDEFVVKNTLAALNLLESAPDPTQLVGLTARLPALRADVVRALVQGHDDQAVAGAMSMYTNADTAGRLAILGALGEHDRFDRGLVADAWQPLLVKAAAETNATLRRAAATLLSRFGSNVVAQVIEPLLADSDPDVRQRAAAALLEILSGFRVPVHVAGVTFDYEELFAATSSGAPATNAPVVTPQRLAAWHQALLKQPAEAELASATALYLTGDASADLPGLLGAYTNAPRAALQRLGKSAAVPALLRKLPWPGGRPILETISSLPELYAMAAANDTNAPAPVREFLEDPVRVRRALEPASAEELPQVLPMLLRARRRGLSLLGVSDQAQKVALSLLESTNTALKAAAVYALGRRDAPGTFLILSNASRSPDPWVRLAAVQGLAQATPDRATLEQRVGPLVGDPDKRVAQVAAVALIEPDTRQVAAVAQYLSYFRFEMIYAGDGESYSDPGEARLTALDTSPPYLTPALARAGTNSVEDAVVFALLLAQHGRPDGLARIIERRPQAGGEKEFQLDMAILTGIALVNDPKFLPFVRTAMDASPDEWRLRTLLRTIKGMSGPEVRQLRVDINRRLRKTGGDTAALVE